MEAEILERSYNPENIEDRWFRFWMEEGLFRNTIREGRPNFCIVIPPPNITGSLHMGHALNNTLQDILIRWKRMSGHNTLWQFGIDHAGIATQNVVERQLSSEGFDRHRIGQERFVERVWEWKKESGGTITKQLKRLGASCDWDRERFTMDEGLSDAVKEVFVRLYEEGLIYRADYIINWCPRCHTALSDLEVNYEGVKGSLYHIKYPFPNSRDGIVVATTRPETMFGDTAVAVNPEDKRYKDSVGMEVMLPLTGRRIPVIADSYVDQKFGTGALKITPAHDPNDFEIGIKYNLGLIKAIDEKGSMTENAGPYKGLDRYKCRKKALKDLEDQKLLVKEESYEHSVGHCYRCHTVIEPLVSKQWFVKMSSLAMPAIDVIKRGEIRIIPSHWEATYFEWMNNIRDWCISRQIWWGHRIPAWHCKDCGQITVVRSEPGICKHCNGRNIEQEEDVLDTWFSSALWPFSTLGWPHSTRELDTYYPTSVMVTGFDILFFWVARMIMMGIKFMGDIPFHDIYLHALVRDESGQKMSKSKGNVIDPLLMMEKYGTDPFRFTLTALTAQGRDICLSEKRIEGYRHFANKIWNASRFVMLNLDGFSSGKPKKESLADRWIIHRLNIVTKDVTCALEEYRFNDMAGLLYQFWWHEFCDWYIEMAKDALAPDADTLDRQAAQETLVTVLDQGLRLLHPVMPFLTEHIWQNIPHNGKSIMVASWPVYDKERDDPEAEKQMTMLMEIIRGIRNIRGEMNISPGVRLKAIIKTQDQETGDIIMRHSRYIISLARLETMECGVEMVRPKASATSIIQGLEISVSLEGVLNFKEESERLKKELKKLDRDLEVLHKKLANEDFITRAPSDVVTKEKGRSSELSEKKKKLEIILKTITKCMEDAGLH
ncbi:valine--tRNA ligase [bacterium]|nr:valine--tRNA ligase [bacterium]